MIGLISSVSYCIGVLNYGGGEKFASVSELACNVASSPNNA